MKTQPQNQIPENSVFIPGQAVPPIRDMIAMKKGVHQNVLIYTWGGLGDVVCSEPVIRFIIENWKGFKISLATLNPELFEHLKFERVYDLRTEKVDPKNFLLIETLVQHDHIMWQYANHMRTHPVDFASMSATGGCLPTDQRQIQLPNFETKYDVESLQNCVVLHPGKHWKVKSFPSEWWLEVAYEFTKSSLTPILVGKTVDKNIGYVDFNAPEGSIDLRDKLTIKEFVSVAKNAPFVFSNDSAIIHIAAAGNAHIGFVATCKHPDFLKHWRGGKFGFRTTNFERDGAWLHLSVEPCQNKRVDVFELPDGMTWESTLPSPCDVVSHFENLNKN